MEIELLCKKLQLVRTWNNQEIHFALNSLISAITSIKRFESSLQNNAKEENAYSNVFWLTTFSLIYIFFFSFRRLTIFSTWSWEIASSKWFYWQKIIFLFSSFTRCNCPRQVLETRLIQRFFSCSSTSNFHEFGDSNCKNVFCKSTLQKLVIDALFQYSTLWKTGSSSWLKFNS